MDLHHLLLAGLPAHSTLPPEADIDEPVMREVRVLNQVFSICELAHSIRSRSADNPPRGGFSHDRIYEATHNRRRNDPSSRIGNLDRTGLYWRTIAGGFRDAAASSHLSSEKLARN